MRSRGLSLGSIIPTGRACSDSRPLGAANRVVARTGSGRGTCTISCSFPPALSSAGAIQSRICFPFPRRLRINLRNRHGALTDR